MTQETYMCGSTLYRRDSSSGFYFPDDTPAEVKRAIDRAYRYKQRVRVFYGDQATGESWGDEWHVIGTIGASMGPCRVPLLIETSRSSGGAALLIETSCSSGGAALLSGCVVAIRATGSREWLHRHASFNPGTWAVQPADIEGYAEAVTLNGTIHARFKKPGQGARYVLFMQGERFAK